MLGFPTVIALHSIGMAVAVGLTITVALCLNGFLGQFADRHLPRFLRIAMWGFLLNLVTGVALFVPRGSDYIGNATFVVKMMLVLVSGTLLAWLAAHLAELARTNVREVRHSVSARRISLVSSVTWIGAVITGRLIAYLGSVY